MYDYARDRVQPLPPSVDDPKIAKALQRLTDMRDEANRAAQHAYDLRNGLQQVAAQDADALTESIVAGQPKPEPKLPAAEEAAADAQRLAEAMQVAVRRVASDAHAVVTERADAYRARLDKQINEDWATLADTLRGLQPAVQRVADAVATRIWLTDLADPAGRHTGYKPAAINYQPSTGFDPVAIAAVIEDLVARAERGDLPKTIAGDQRAIFAPGVAQNVQPTFPTSKQTDEVAA